MKAIITSITIFLCITALGVTELIVTNNYTKTLNNYTDKIKTAVQQEDIQSLKTELKTFSDNWLKMRSVLSLITEHKPLFEIDNALIQLEFFSQKFDSAEAMLAISELSSIINTITETSAFSFENII